MKQERKQGNINVVARFGKAGPDTTKHFFHQHGLPY